MTGSMAQGATLTFDGDTVVDVSDIQDFGPENDDVDVTSHSSPNRTRETIPGLKNPGTFSMEMFLDPTDPTHVALWDNCNASALDFTTVPIVLTFADPFSANGISVDGYVKSFKPHVPADGALTASVVIRCTGPMTLNGS